MFSAGILLTKGLGKSAKCLSLVNKVILGLFGMQEIRDKLVSGPKFKEKKKRSFDGLRSSD